MTNATDPMRPAHFTVRERVQETDDTFTLDLVAKNGNGVLSFSPGQFNMLYVFGVGEIPISVCGDPNDPERCLHTTRAVGTVTRAMSALRPGDTLGVRGPFGSHWPIEDVDGCDVVIVTGGIGLAPLRPVLYALLADRERFGRLVLLYGARSPEEILYRNELAEWRARFDMDVFVTVDRAAAGWRGNVGVVTTLIPRAPFDPHNTIAMICGPEVMMRYTVKDLRKRGVDLEKIYLSLERNMKCAIGFCGRCQFGPHFVCKDGPVFSYPEIAPLFNTSEV